MEKSLVGYTGFVGSNLNESCKFNNVYNSKNIEEAFGTNPDLLVYAGVPAQKFIANKFPQKDIEIIENAKLNIKKINPKKIVLISTIDVYKDPVDVDENTVIDTDNLQPYGLNRFHLEEWVKKNFKDYLIVRLPGLYGNKLKKNFIFDLINVIPSMLKSEKYNELLSINSFIKDYYIDQNNGFFKCKELSEEERTKLKNYFNTVGFSAVNFTDSRGIYQFYNLKYLWNHIEIALQNNIKLLNIATEPISVAEIYKEIKNEEFNNCITDNIPYYNYKSIYAKVISGKQDYIFNKEFILDDIKQFIINR